MSLSVEIEDGKNGTKTSALVTKRGQLVTSPLDFSVPAFNEMAIASTAYNFFVPKAGEQFVVTDIIASATRDVSNTDGALVEIFTASSATSTTAVSAVLTLQLVRNDTQGLTGLNFITEPGVWLNAVTDDATVFLTIAGYYVEENR